MIREANDAIVSLRHPARHSERPPRIVAADRIFAKESWAGHTVALHRSTRQIEVLANLPHREGAVFRCPDGSPYARRIGGGGQISTAFNAACRRACIKDFRPHDCRHTWATWLYSETRDIRLLMELGGWKSIKMVEGYTHVNPDHLRKAIDTLPDRAKPVQSVA